MSLLVTLTFSNSECNSVNNYEEMFVKQEHIYENFDQKIDYYYVLPITAISKNIVDKCIEAFNRHGRLNMKFSSEAKHLAYMFETDTDICTKYIKLSKALNRQLSLIVVDLENAIKNECPNLIMN